MITPPPTPNPADLTLQDRTARQLRALAELSDMAMDLARDAHRDAKATPAPAATAAFDRIARTAARLFALETWIAEGHAARAAEQDRLRADADHKHRFFQKQRLRRDIGRAIEAAPKFTRAQRFRLEHYLDNIGLDDELATTPIAEIVAKLCRTLGIAPAQAPDLTAFADPEPKTRADLSDPVSSPHFALPIPPPRPAMLPSHPPPSG